MLGKIKKGLKKIAECDVRSLATFRIGIALVLLADLAIRATLLKADYTSEGLLPKEALLEKFLHVPPISVYLISDQFWFQAALFIIAAIAAIAMLVGYKTKAATIVSWFMLISIQTRNPIILQGGDVLLRMLMFWAMFLPLGAYKSIDARSKTHIPKRILSIGTIALYAQIIILYFFSALEKNGTHWIPDGTAIYYALSIDQFVTPVGSFFLQFPTLLQYMTYGVWWIELVGPFLLLIPFFFTYVRTFTVFLFIALQAGFGSMLALGPFPWVASVMMLACLPSGFWDAIKKNTKLVEKVEQKNKALTIIVTAIGSFFIIYILLWNIQSATDHQFFSLEEEKIALSLRIDQLWNMFSPYPLTDDGWYVIPGTLANGKEVDLFREGSPVNWDKPEDVSVLYPNERWRKYMMNLWLRENDAYRPYYARYLCQEWNDAHGAEEKLVKLKLIYMREDTLLPPNVSTPYPVELLSYACP